MGRDKVITGPPLDDLRSWPRRRAPGQLHGYIIFYQEQSHGGCNPDADSTPQAMQETPSQAERSSNDPAIFQQLWFRTLRLNRLAALLARFLACWRFCLRMAGLMKPKSKLREISACASASTSSSSEQRHCL
jgi:hypothetical protein